MRENVHSYLYIITLLTLQELTTKPNTKNLFGGQVKPSQDKVLTGGGDLHEAEVDVPQSVNHSCV